LPADLGWNWTYGICSILYGVFIIILFLFCPETAYRRDAALNTDLGTEDRAEELNEKRLAEKTQHLETVESVDAEQSWSEPKNSYWHDLKIFHGRQSDDPYWKVLTRPLLMLIFPQVLFSFFAYGLTTSWLIVVGSVLALIFTAPPYNFSVSGVGLISIASLIGAILGAFVTGPLADWVVKFMSRRNKGTYEPEFRLVIIIVSLVLGGMSFFGFGWSLEVQDPWIGPAWLAILLSWLHDNCSVRIFDRLPSRQGARSVRCHQSPEHLFFRDELFHRIVDLVARTKASLLYRWRSACIHL
jgi:hypothetical protein